MDAENVASSADGVRMEAISFPASDGRMLNGHLFLPDGSVGTGDGAVVAIGPAAAVPSRFYRHFAQAVAQRGHPCVTFDVRDIGVSRAGSVRGVATRMRDWAVHDVGGAIAAVESRFPGRPLHWVGHSMGGFATGIADNGRKVARQLCVATLNGYWGRMDGFEKWRVLAMMGTFAPLVLATRGYMPGALMGGEDMPAPAFEEWRRWCLDPDFLFGDETLPERGNIAAFQAPIRFLQFADDPWGTPASVGDMAARFHGSADRQVIPVSPREVGAPRIGHMGFFRPEFRQKLWRPHLDWLLAPAGAPSAPASE